MNSGAVQIGRLRVRGAVANTPALRLRLAHLLNTTSLQPDGLPPSAVLVVRQLSDPLPGRLARQQMAHRADPAWESAARRSLSDLYRRAARPQQGIIAGDPEAVLFADEAEMLACLLLARQRNVTSGAWWRWAVGDRPGPASSLFRRLVAEPALTPAVLGHLVAWKAVEQALAPLAEGETLALIQAVTRQYQLPALSVSVVSAPDISTLSAPARHEEKVGSGIQTETGKAAGDISPPWAGIVPGIVSYRLTPVKQALLGLCLALQARPAAARTAAFQHGWQQWWEQSVTSAPVTSEQRVPPLDDKPTARRVEQVERASVSNEKSSPAQDDVVQTATARHEDGADLIRLARQEVAAHASGQTAGGEEWTPAARRPEVEAPLQQSHMPAAVETQETEPELDTLTWATNGVETGLGGVLYLLNVMRRLDLPASAEAGWGIASQLGAWGLLELLGRALLADASEAYSADPLWRVLAALDGRAPRQMPGADFRQVGDGSFPSGWQAIAERGDSQPAVHMAGISPDLTRWLDVAVPVIRYRLAAALELPENEIGSLLQVSGRVYGTRTHLDLIMPLSAISLPVRRAGLDANPGWLAAFGRIVTFHFQ